MLELVSMIVGAVVGAGFASGKELVTFFAAFGSAGYWGIGLMTLLFLGGGLLIVGLCQKLNCDTYEALLNAVFPPRWAKFFAFLVSAGLWLGLGLMLSGCGTLGEIFCAWPRSVGFALAMAAVFVPLAGEGEGFLRLNGLLLPVLVILAVVTCLAFLSRPVPTLAACGAQALTPSWPVAAVLYWLYNLLLALAMLSSVRRKQKIKPAIVLSAVIIGLLALLMCCCLSLLPMEMQANDLPMLALARQMGAFFGLCYGVVMALALYTTALANCYGLAVNFGRHHNKTTLLLLILLPTAVFGPFPFGQLVTLIYPLLGYASAPIVAAMVLKAVKLHFGG